MRGEEKVGANSMGDLGPCIRGGQTLHVAVVYGVNDVRYVTAAESRAELAVRLANYVRRHAGHQLSPGDARRLRRLLAARLFEAAVEHYFARVGRRWDEERLVVEAVDLERVPDAASLTDAARHPDRQIVYTDG